MNPRGGPGAPARAGLLLGRVGHAPPLPQVFPPQEAVGVDGTGRVVCLTSSTGLHTVQSPGPARPAVLSQHCPPSPPSTRLSLLRPEVGQVARPGPQTSLLPVTARAGCHWWGRQGGSLGRRLLSLGRGRGDG